jgi:MoaA/NifB/PqqE/SkfB family radical SAM enzyme
MLGCLQPRKAQSLTVSRTVKLASYYYNFFYGVHLRKPRLMWRIAKNYTAIMLKKAMPLRYIDACVTLSCNIRCDHCFAENFKANGRQELSRSEWRNIVDQCHELGNLAIGFTGGEPLLYGQLEDLISQCRPWETLILVSTNGMYLTAARARSLYRAGVDVAQVSVESIDPDEHNEFRHDSQAFGKTMQGIRNAVAAGIKVAVVPTVSHLNVRSAGFLGLLEWAYRKRLMVNLALATPMGNWNARMDVLLTEEDFTVIDELVARYPNVRRDFETNYFRRGCGAATEKLYFTPYGDVLSCPYMHISFGNVRDRAVADLRRDMLSTRELAGYHPKCLVAEDSLFIENRLSKAFHRTNGLAPWEEVFGEAPSQPSPHPQPRPPLDHELAAAADVPPVFATRSRPASSTEAAPVTCGR